MSLSSSFKYLSVFALVIFVFTGCKKEEGPGGTSTIKGRIIVHDFDGGFQNPTPVEIYPAIDQDIFLIYGADHSTYDDDYKTTYDGTYEFKYLQKGKYRLFAYSKDSTGASVFLPSFKDIPVFVDVEITSNGSTVTAPDIIILDNKQ